MPPKRPPEIVKPSSPEFHPKEYLGESEEARGSLVLVTGAAGTVGIYVLNELLQNGFKVRANDLPGRTIDIRAMRLKSTEADEVDPVTPLLAGKLELFYEDLSKRDAAIRAMQGVTHVIHLAAIIDLSLPYEGLIKRVNVDMTKYLFDAACAAKVKRFVFFSSASIYRGKEGLEENGETDEVGPDSPYEQSKLDAEQYITEHVSPSKPDTIIFRPGMIYGPRAQFLGIKIALIPVVMYAFMGTAIKIGGLGKSNFVHAEDVARASVFFLCHKFGDGPVCETFNVVEKDAISAGNVVEIAAKAMSIPILMEVNCPRWLRSPLQFLSRIAVIWRITSAVLYWIWAYLRWWHGLEDRINTIVDSAAVKYSAQEMIFSNRKLLSTGFVLKHDVRKSMKDVLRWYIENKWMPHYPHLTNAPTFEVETGFKFHEIMQGECRFLYGERHRTPMSFECDVVIPSLKQFQSQRIAMLKGTVDLQGVASKSEILEGALHFYVRPAGLKYDFKFIGNAGPEDVYHFVGEKKYSLWDPVTTLTTCHGELIHDGINVADSTVTFDLKDMAKFLASMKFTNPCVGPITRPRIASSAWFFSPSRFDSNFWYVWSTTKDGRAFALGLIERPKGLELRIALFDASKKVQERHVELLPPSALKWNKGELTMGGVCLSDTGCDGSIEKVHFSINFDLSEGRKMTFSPSWMKLKLIPSVNSRYGKIARGTAVVGGVPYPIGTRVTISDYVVPYGVVRSFPMAFISAMDFDQGTDLQIELTGTKLFRRHGLAMAFVNYEGREWSLNDPFVQHRGAVTFTEGTLDQAGENVQLAASIKHVDFSLDLTARAPRTAFARLRTDGFSLLYLTAIGTCTVTIEPTGGEKKTFTCHQRALLQTKSFENVTASPIMPAELEEGLTRRD